MNFVRPVPIASPISGQLVQPRIIERDQGDSILVEAHWIDPQSGTFIRKGTVEIRQKNVVSESTEEKSNCCNAAFIGEVSDGHGRCSKCKEMASVVSDNSVDGDDD